MPPSARRHPARWESQIGLGESSNHRDFGGHEGELPTDVLNKSLLPIGSRALSVPIRLEAPPTRMKPSTEFITISRGAEVKGRPDAN